MLDSKIRIRTLDKNEIELFRTLRLKALQESPDSFDQIYEHELEKPISYWQKLAAGVTEGSGNTMVIALRNNEVAGVVYGFNKSKNIGSFGGMWVAIAHRNLGVATLLIEAVLKWAKNECIEKMEIWNMEGNLAAEKLYLKCGFQPTGTIKPLINHPDKQIVQLSRIL